MTASPMLELAGVSRSFGSLKAVDGVDLRVPRGARHAVIGPNGAGKSTLFALVAGTLAGDAGRVLLAGQDVTRLPEHRRARLGVARGFQHPSVFLSLTALDNVALAAQRFFGVGGRMWRPARGYAEVTAAAREALDRVGLAAAADVPAAALSHGERRQLEVALALATRPRLLLLDEPTAGMSAAETERFAGLVAALPDEVTVLIIEHDLDVVFRLATAVTVLHLGRVLADGSPAEVRADAEVQRAYLGSAAPREVFIEESG